MYPDEMEYQENPVGGLLAVVNPSRRRRKKSARRASKRVRRMTAKQLKYFGPRRSRVAKRRSRRRTLTVSARPNPIRRRSRRSVRRSARRSFQRNPVGSPAMRATLGQVQKSMLGAATGAAGAVATDVLMAQAARFIPATMASRMSAEGGINFGYYAVKLGIALGLGIGGAKFLPGKLKGISAKAAEGAMTVSAYEIARAMMPASVVLGYMTPGRGAGVAAYLARRRGIGAYLQPGTTQTMAGRPGFSETRVGEGSIQ